MAKCKNCGIPIKNIPGKRAKTFCSTTCRSSFWQKNDRAQKKTGKKKAALTPKQLVDKYPNMGIMMPVKEKTPGIKAKVAPVSDYLQRRRDLKLGKKEK